MKIIFDPNKNEFNLLKHNISLSLANQLEWSNMLSWIDDRVEYGEVRQIGLAPINQRLYVVVFVDRFFERRIISLRKANLRECERYEKENN